MSIRLRLIAIFTGTAISLLTMEFVGIELYEYYNRKDRELRINATESIQRVKDTQLAWRNQVQAWHNILLRSYDSSRFHPSLKAFYQQERRMRAASRTLRQEFEQKPNYLLLIDELDGELRKLSLLYRQTLQLFDASLEDAYTVADQQLREAAERPDELLEQLLLQLVKDRDAAIAESNREFRTSVQGILIGEGVATLLLLGLLLWLFEHTLGTPLGKLTNAARQIARGNLDVQIEDRLPGEFRWLSKAFNQMVDGLQTITDKLTGKIAELEQENRIRTETETELKQRTQDLIQAQQEIECHAATLEQAVDARTKELWHQANYDRLTGLPNRSLFNDRLNHTLQTANRYKHQAALLFIDLDHFKRLNDTMGHDSGDRILFEVAKRLKETVRDSDTVARLGGDEFVVILAEIDHENQAARVAGKILSLFEHPFTHSDVGETYLSASIGISFYPQDGETRSDLLKHADAAMYRAKEEGRNKYAYYTVDISSAILKRVKIEHELRKSDYDRDFYLCYQPLVDAKSMRVVGAEALLRWEHPTQGLISPDDFIPIAEETGQLVELGKQMLHRVCLQQVAWHDQGLDAIRIAINISPIQFSHPGFLNEVKEIIEDTGVDPGHLELEITETCLMLHASENIALLEELKSLGLSLSIDDFGIGYSSLNYLKRFPVDNLKIDRSFVLDVLDDASDNAICKAIVAMGQSLGIRVIAEGVETAEHLAFLKEMGCDELQGYYLGRPARADSFETHLKQLRSLAL